MRRELPLWVTSSVLAALEQRVLQQQRVVAFLEGWEYVLTFLEEVEAFPWDITVKTRVEPRLFCGETLQGVLLDLYLRHGLRERDFKQLCEQWEKRVV